jgi:Ca-activated chloride channel family protein
MASEDSMRFLHPDLLWGLALLPVLLLAVIGAERRRRRRIGLFAGGTRGKYLTLHLVPHRALWRNLLGLAAGAFLLVATARPQVPAGKVPVVRRGHDVAVLLDVSGSMLAEDLPPNRLLYARRLLKGCLDGMEGDRVALVAFAGEAYAQCPLTLDRSALNIFLEALGPDVIGRAGTGLAGALRKGVEVVGGREDRTRALLLLTDGEDHEGEVDAILSEASTAGVRIIAVGIGSREGEPIPIPETGGRKGYKRDGQGKVVMTRLHEEALQGLARGTGGFYVRASGSGAEIDAVLDYLDGLEEGDIEGGVRILYEERYGDLVVPALLLLGLRGLLRERRGRGRRRAALPAAAAGLAFLVAAPALEADEADPVKLSLSCAARTGATRGCLSTWATSSTDPRHTTAPRPPSTKRRRWPPRTHT